MRANKLRNLFYLQLIAALGIVVFSCNSTTTDEPDIVVTSSNVAIREFYFQEMSSVMTNLDSVFFSIDLERGVIFNSDSLPKGTKVSRLIPIITFANTLTKADLTFNKDNQGDTTINYLENPTDSIDFTNPVKLEVTAQDGVSKFTYMIKVNVHKVNPDTVEWAMLAKSDLPSRLQNPKSQKTVWHSGKAYCLIAEADGSYTLSTNARLNDEEWTKQSFTSDFEILTESFTASENAFYVLGTDGNLWRSEDALQWQSTGNNWMAIVGGYQDMVLGVRKDESGNVLHTRYPLGDDFVEKEAASDFPIYQSSTLQVIENLWAPYPTAIRACGVTEGGAFSSSIWAYDGYSWATVNNSPLPEVKSPMLVRYVVYKNTQVPNVKREFDAWILFGGVFEDGEFNREVYYSIDNGVKWSVAPSGMQLPERFPDLYSADALTVNYPLTADLTDAWTWVENLGTRTSYEIDGTDITWNCPYIYVFGGYTSEETLSTRIWRGVLNRVKFTPSL